MHGSSVGHSQDSDASDSDSDDKSSSDESLDHEGDVVGARLPRYTRNKPREW